MGKFMHTFRYIDDLCWINNENAHIFLDPQQPRISSNPFWIYLLHIMEIKTEVLCFSTINPTFGVKAHFMNMLVSISNEDDGTFTLQKLDKHRELPFSYTQYINI